MRLDDFKDLLVDDIILNATDELSGEEVDLVEYGIYEVVQIIGADNDSITVLCEEI